MISIFSPPIALAAADAIRPLAFSTRSFYVLSRAAFSRVGPSEKRGHLMLRSMPPLFRHSRAHFSILLFQMLL